MTCTVNKFVYEVNNGEETNEIPKWMGVDKIISSYESSKKLIPIMKDNYMKTFSDNENKGNYFTAKMDDLIKQMDSIYSKYYMMIFKKINPRKSTKIGDNTFIPYFISVI